MSTVVDHHSPHLNEFVAPAQEQNIHHQQHQPHPILETENINEIPNHTDIKQVIFAIYIRCIQFISK